MRTDPSGVRAPESECVMGHKVNWPTAKAKARGRGRRRRLGPAHQKEQQLKKAQWAAKRADPKEPTQ